MKLRWEKHSATIWYAFLGRVRIAMVIGRHDGTVSYQVDGVHMKWIAKGYGEVNSMSSGRRSVERAWRQWLEHANMVPLKGESQEDFEMRISLP